jgi:hypothetical protein
MSIETLLTPPSLATLPALFRWPVILIPLLVGVSLYLLARAHPRLRAYRPPWEELAELEAPRPRGLGLAAPPTGSPLWSPLARVAAISRPLIEDLGGLIRRARAVLGLREPETLATDLELVMPATTPLGYHGLQALLGTLGIVVPLGCNALGWGPPLVGAWPAWSMGALALLLGLAPSWHLQWALRERRAAIVAELPDVMTLLLNIVSGGHSARMAIDTLAVEGAGVIAGQLRWAKQQHDAASNTRGYAGFLEEMAERNRVAELTQFVRTLKAALDEGLPLPEVLPAQIETIHTEQGAALTASAGRRRALMMLPMVLIAIPTLIAFIVTPFLFKLLGLYS